MSDGTAHEAEAEAPGRVGEVIKRVTLNEIRLRHAHAHLFIDSLEPGWDEEADLFWGIEVESELGADVLAVSAACVVQYWSDPSLAPEDRSDPDFGEGERPDLEVVSQFEITWKVEDPDALTAADLQAFADNSPVVNAWPYWREHLQSVTARMGVPPLLLPAYKVPSGRLTPKG